MTHILVEASHGRVAHNQMRQNPYLLCLERCRIAPYHSSRRFESRHSHISLGQPQKLALALSHSRSPYYTVQPRCNDYRRLPVTTFCLSAPLNTIYPRYISLRLRDPASHSLNKVSFAR